MGVDVDGAGLGGELVGTFTCVGVVADVGVWICGDPAWLGTRTSTMALLDTCTGWLVQASQETEGSSPSP
ncbi:hypothetical protein V6N12_013827 [Hibiscus sabdariffa]|uniref:Uncharacterized protein n=1 Tax=Hibiscus sabdariffa TaxID=183260 RepID=A0ABR2B6Q7_9ROSI